MNDSDMIVQETDRYLDLLIKTDMLYLIDIEQIEDKYFGVFVAANKMHNGYMQVLLRKNNAT